MKARNGEHFDYYTCEDIEKELTKEELKQFSKWINGQTCGIVDNQCVYYSEDVERFIRMVRKGIPTYFD
ncbi:MAG TPA: hypothetical protein VI911_08590 [Patescibacteria group bacterium]|nr:MAG: hypothetical protein UR43_C0005G0115 [candidate division TM6 bacterium GW2011_GWF2_33_332]HLD91053.1 hypothetical protein [Patescibacteria group bacterium]